MSDSSDTIILPAPRKDQVYVSISALDAGWLTLPEHLFITSAPPSKRTTVPSLSFLIRHPSPSSSPSSPSSETLTLFDLGLKRDTSQYTPSQQLHISHRQPTITSPDCASSLLSASIPPSTINTVILSHVHWDHIGTPSDFPNAKFIVGSGTLHLLAHGAGPLYPANLFNHDELPFNRTYELPPSPASDPENAVEEGRQTGHSWERLACFEAAVDFFGDGSLYVVDAPGHLTGHVNLLARVGVGRWVYLGGDCCHDVRILRGEEGVAVYDDGFGMGGKRSVHLDTEVARGMIGRVGALLGGRVFEEGMEGMEGVGRREVSVEVVVAHDKGWAEGNQGAFLPGCI